LAAVPRIFVPSVRNNMTKILKFPKGFLWGAATSAHQVEGGNKNEWWAWSYKKSKMDILGIKVQISKTGRAADHYNCYEEDFNLVKKLNQNAHRFSIEWSRIEPKEGQFNFKELKHYQNVIRALKERNIIPFVTLHHFTCPIWFYRKGNWLNKKSPDYFNRYVEFFIKNIKEEVDFYITINEPINYASWYLPLQGAYQGNKWPNLLDILRAIKNLIKAHQKAYKTLHQYGPKNIQVGIAKNNIFFDGRPKILVSLADWYWNRMFLDKIKNEQDFIGLNYYFHSRIKPGFKNPKNWINQNENKIVSDLGWEIYPEGIYHVLKDLKKYQKPIYITENGLADEKDKLRENFIKDHLYWIHKAIGEEIDIRGYFHWSLMDNYEWEKGFWPRFGLIEIDYKTLERKIRPSAEVYAKICQENAVFM